MKRTYMNSLDFSAVILSAFDIGGSLLTRNIVRHSNGLQHDMNQLMNDQKVLEEDYRNACEKIANDQKNRQ